MLSKPKRRAARRASLPGYRSVLLSGAALNWIGAAKMARQVWARPPEPGAPADHAQLTAFTSGTAATFGAFYLYLAATRKPAFPLLTFGAALKSWAFVLSAVLRAQGRLDRANLLSFGVTNGVVSALFWAHIASDARGRRG